MSPPLPRRAADELDAAHELIVRQMDQPAIATGALHQWHQAVVTTTLMAQLSGIGLPEMRAVGEHLDTLRARTPFTLTATDRYLLERHLEVMEAVIRITPRHLAAQAAIITERAFT